MRTSACNRGKRDQSGSCNQNGRTPESAERSRLTNSPAAAWAADS